MTPRLDPYAVSPEVMQELISFQEFLQTTGLEPGLVELVRARVAQLNGCTRGIRRHVRSARVLGETGDRISALGAWRSATTFTERERAAFAWAEAVTLAARREVPGSVFEGARQWFTDAEVVKLTLVVAATTAWNRIETSLWQNSPVAGERLC
jgi:AhpD family alkylhydroperoxidase